ncbi:MAG: ATP synthase F1 subunit delta [Rickettsiales bacterium]|nr:ATP synthase F1 subunit delta [Rickettsiales bacterium]
MAASQAGKTTITRRYAASLFDYLNSDKVQKGKFDAVENELQQLAQAIEEDASLTRRLSGPLLSKDAMEKILEGVAKAVSLSSATKEFCRVLIRNRRFHLLPQIAREFSAQTAEARGEVTADVVSAVALGSKESKQLAATLEKSTGKRVALNQRVDDSLLGGMRVTVGSVMVDASLAGKLQRLKLHLKQTEEF